MPSGRETSRSIAGVFGAVARVAGTGSAAGRRAAGQQLEEHRRGDGSDTAVHNVGGNFIKVEQAHAHIASVQVERLLTAGHRSQPCL